jgi:A/G-specific adenine glycosylase
MRIALKFNIVNHPGGSKAHLAPVPMLGGIGVYTARAVCCFAFGSPEILIETNIRTACIHHFFADHMGGGGSVEDGEIVPFLSSALVRERSPREWYFALMDYGAHLKRTVGNASRTSAHYQKQTRFRGSAREARGRILKLLLSGARRESELADQATLSPERVESALSSLVHDGFIAAREQHYSLRE